MHILSKSKDNLAERLYFFGLKLGFGYFFSGKIIKGIARLLCPIHFIRCKELPVALKMLEPKSGEKILDISSPKILSLYYARHYKSDVYATDILEQPLEEALLFRRRFSLDNLFVQKEDARSLSFPDNYFDKIFSVSVFEHIAPARKGEIPAVREAVRVLKAGGILVLTLAFANSYFEEYKKGSVYERQAKKNELNFFQRFYDDETLAENIIHPSGLELLDKVYIGEKYYTKTPGSTLSNYIDSSWLQIMFFGPFHKIFSNWFLVECREKSKLRKPVIVCLKLKKKI